MVTHTEFALATLVAGVLFVLLAMHAIMTDRKLRELEEHIRATEDRP